MTLRIIIVALGVVLGALVASALTRAAEGQEPDRVEASIVMLIDYSNSVSDEELEWQLRGLLEVFADPALEERMGQTETATYAVTVMLFAEDCLPVMPWTILRAGDGSVERFRRQLEAVFATPRDQLATGSGATDQADAIFQALLALETGPPSDRRIVDLQTDDVHRGGLTGVQAPAIRQMERMRAEAWARNVILNVILIGTPGMAGARWSDERIAEKQREAQLWHETHTVSGTVWMAYDYPSYRKALMVKVLGEIS